MTQIKDYTISKQKERVASMNWNYLWHDQKPGILKNKLSCYNYFFYHDDQYNLPFIPTDIIVKNGDTCASCYVALMHMRGYQIFQTLDFCNLQIVRMVKVVSLGQISKALHHDYGEIYKEIKVIQAYCNTENHSLNKKEQELLEHIAVQHDTTLMQGEISEYEVMNKMLNQTQKNVEKTAAGEKVSRDYELYGRGRCKETTRGGRCKQPINKDGLCWFHSQVASGIKLSKNPQYSWEENYKASGIDPTILEVIVEEINRGSGHNDNTPRCKHGFLAGQCSVCLGHNSPPDIYDEEEEAATPVDKQFQINARTLKVDL